MVGDNSLCDILRCLTCAELFLNCDFYYKHPLLVSIYDDNVDIFPTFDSLFSICVSNFSLETNAHDSCLVKEEAKYNSRAKAWSSFISILALSSVIKRSIITSYPDFGLVKYRLPFNQQIFPRDDDCGFSPFRILFCNMSKTPVTIKQTQQQIFCQIILFH